MNKTFVPKFTYIVPFRFQYDRMVAFKRAIEWISGFGGIEIIVVEQDKHSKISNLSFKGQHLFVESDLPFNKSWAYNVALKISESPVIVFGDADFMMNPNELIESLRMLESADCVIPTSNIVKLNPQESHYDLMSILNIKRPSPKTCLTDGISIFKKEAIFKIGGWNEDILGPGYANKFQDLKMKRMLNIRQMDYTGYHLHHMPDKNDQQLSQRNQQIIDFYTNPLNDLNSHISNMSQKFGLKNKYQF